MTEEGVNKLKGLSSSTLLWLIPTYEVNISLALEMHERFMYCMGAGGL